MTDPVVEDYLKRLDTAARVLPDDHRRELVDEIAAHISASRTAGAGLGEAGLRTVLDRLGEPAEIVAAARAEEADWSPNSSSGPGSAGPGLDAAARLGPQLSADGSHVRELRPPGTGTETAAVLMLTVGSIIPVIGWVVGVVLLWSSRRWRTGEKVLATLVFPGGPGLALIASTIGIGGAGCSSSSSGRAGSDSTVTGSCTHTGLLAAGFVLFGLWVLAPIVIATVLFVRARRRAATEPPVEHWRPVGQVSRWGPLEMVGVALLTVGAFVVPVVSPVVGLACVWRSRAWTTRDKCVATAIAAIPAVAWLAELTTVSLGTDLIFGWAALVSFALVGLAPAAAGLVLVLRLNAQRT